MVLYVWMGQDALRSCVVMQGLKFGFVAWMFDVWWGFVVGFAWVVKPIGSCFRLRLGCWVVFGLDDAMVSRLGVWGTFNFGGGWLGLGR